MWKHRHVWVVIALLLAGCTAGAAETTESASTAPPPSGSQVAVAAQPSAEPSGSADTTAPGEPVPLESVGAGRRDDDGGLTDGPPMTLPSGTYRSSTYPVPVTFTTTDELLLCCIGVALVLDQQFNEKLLVGQPDLVADLSPAISLQEFQDFGAPGIPEDRLMELPEDVGAWLDDAEAIDIVDEGSTTVGGQEALWWEVELRKADDVDAACIPEASAPPCQPLWFGAPQTGNPAGVFASTISRIWAVPSADRTVLVQAEAPADGTASAWFDTAEDIVASFEFD